MSNSSLPPPIQRLFSYGTLQLEAVQLSTFGRRLVGMADGLPGYEQTVVEIKDPQVIATSGNTHHPIVSLTGRASDVVQGTVFEVTAKELEDADTYEVGDYKRVAVTLASGASAWVYVDARGGVAQA